MGIFITRHLTSSKQTSRAIMRRTRRRSPRFHQQRARLLDPLVASRVPKHPPVQPPVHQSLLYSDLERNPPKNLGPARKGIRMVAPVMLRCRYNHQEALRVMSGGLQMQWSLYLKLCSRAKLPIQTARLVRLMKTRTTRITQEPVVTDRHPRGCPVHLLILRTA